MTPANNISVRANDTDVFILLLYHKMFIPSSSNTLNVWMDVGLGSSNTRRFININQLLTKLDPSVVKALPALHAFTGCDYTASFMNKGKVKPLDLMMKSQTHIDAFAQLGENETITHEVESKIESFVCAMYGQQRLPSVDSARLKIFQQNISPQRKTKNSTDLRELTLALCHHANCSSAEDLQNKLCFSYMETSYFAASIMFETRTKWMASCKQFSKHQVV